ncbi:methylmalonyl-CoA mutase [Platysternon megacephalum]|uniref:Methylmalonyl-CoA mutase n=1 Tax=Platysternon megacephalum TaxID=55544 RepID=A0A4D9DIP5_9SAUR|nr:methylmalonyl-CoA mutase [Platysternon megacephalum]
MRCHSRLPQTHSRTPERRAAHGLGRGHSERLGGGLGARTPGGLPAALRALPEKDSPPELGPHYISDPTAGTSVTASPRPPVGPRSTDTPAPWTESQQTPVFESLKQARESGTGEWGLGEWRPGPCWVGGSTSLRPPPSPCPHRAGCTPVSVSNPLCFSADVDSHGSYVNISECRGRGAGGALLALHPKSCPQPSAVGGAEVGGRAAGGRERESGVGGSGGDGEGVGRGHFALPPRPWGRATQAASLSLRLRGGLCESAGCQGGKLRGEGQGVSGGASIGGRENRAPQAEGPQSRPGLAGRAEGRLRLCQRAVAAWGQGPAASVSAPRRVPPWGTGCGRGLTGGGATRPMFNTSESPR